MDPVPGERVEHPPASEPEKDVARVENQPVTKSEKSVARVENRPVKEFEKDVARVVFAKSETSLPKRRGKKNRFLINLVIVWLVLIGLVFLGYEWYVKTEAESKSAADAVGEVVVADQELNSMLREALPDCEHVLKMFLTEKDVDSRVKWVLIHGDTTAKMKRHDESDSPFSIKVDQLYLSGKTIIRLSDGPCVVTQWKTPSGDWFDAAFRKQEGAWKLDWEHFVRFNDSSWESFLAGSGPDEAEFRLLARERLYEDARNQEPIRLTLYEPLINRMDDIGRNAPAQPISRGGFNGSVLSEAFRHARDGKHLLGSTLADANPLDMIRVRVVVRRVLVEGKTKYEISDVKACHWYQSDDLGVDPIGAGGSPGGKSTN